MEIHQLKTFVAVAREGSITRASQRLHLSQPAVSAHIKALEEELGLDLFERTQRGMRLTSDGQRLLAKAEQALGAHQALMVEASRIKGRPHGKLRLGAGGSTDRESIGRLVTTLAERCPDVEVALEHRTSREIVAGIHDGTLDAGWYNEAGDPAQELATVDVSRFDIFVTAPPRLVPATRPLDWPALAELPWIFPTSGGCCAETAERLFDQHGIRPSRIISIDRESITRSLVAGGVGIGLLHADTAKDAEARGEVELLCDSGRPVRVLFACLAGRAQEPLLDVARAIAQESQSRT